MADSKHYCALNGKLGLISDTAINAVLMDKQQKEIACFTSICWKVGCQMRLHDFLHQQVCFVQEEDGGGLLEPRVWENGLEQGKALSQSILKKGGQIILDNGKVSTDRTLQNAWK